ncbi:Uncharacterized protein BM_BM1315 [Brugia malayi]|uniref:Bm1315 n=1 Tax=Brugia malayi TaxID=6279 RepID=A0A0K0IX04_BRUMA|nr:Uncharacterized protein BM_BM1315 [Brugia malayi]CDP95744.1 Bm1315 [Brugia malayi]VIO91108.1 Uncharacterized protein BM_BM1315 [Brugia malayi]
MLKFLHLISAKKEKSHNCDHLMQHHVTDEIFTRIEKIHGDKKSFSKFN